jgi:hypothetical protein
MRWVNLGDDEDGGARFSSLLCIYHDDLNAEFQLPALFSLCFLLHRQ